MKDTLCKIVYRLGFYRLAQKISDKQFNKILQEEVTIAYIKRIQSSKKGGSRR